MQPMMNAAKVKACMKKGGSRERCMRQAYPERYDKSAPKKKPMPRKGGY